MLHSPLAAARVNWTSSLAKRAQTFSCSTKSNCTFHRSVPLQKATVSIFDSEQPEKQKTKYKPNLTSSQKIVREVDIPVKISVQELASRMSEKTGDVVKALMKSGIMATANQYIDGDTAELIVTELGHTPKREEAISLKDEIANHQKTK